MIRRENRLRVGALALVVVTLLAASSGCLHIRFNPRETTTPTVTFYPDHPTATTTARATPAAPSPTSPAAVTPVPTTSAPAATTTRPAASRAGIYGNTNGNLANGGFALYDPVTRGHLLGIGGALLFYDPATGKTEKRLELPDRATHLLVSEDGYYYINAADQAFYRLRREDGEVEKIADAACTYAARVNHYVQFLQDGQLMVYYEGKGRLPESIRSGTGILEPSLGSNRVYYISGDGEYRVSANNGQGRTTVYKGTAFQAVHHLFQIGSGEFVFVDRQGAGETIYRMDESGAAPTAIAAIGTYAAIPSLCEGTSGQMLYYIAYVDSIPVLYSYDFYAGAAHPVEIARLAGDRPFVCVVEDWCYVLDAASGVMHRINPVTGAAELVRH